MKNIKKKDPKSSYCKIPSSKSVSARALLLSAMVPNDIKLYNVSQSQDTQDLLNIFDELNTIKTYEDYVVVKQLKELNQDSLNLGEGGTTSRFLIPLLALFKTKVKLLCHPRLKLRPFDQLFIILRSMGALIEESEESNVLCLLQGPINLVDLNIDCAKTTQFYSGLKMLEVNSSVNITSNNVVASKMYLQQTDDMVELFKSHPSEFFVPTDMSSLMIAVICSWIHNEQVDISQVSLDYSQADSILLNMFDSWNIENKVFKTSHFQNQNVLEFDGAQAIDLVPMLVVLGLFKFKTVKLLNLKTLTFKESNRFEAIKSFLDQIGVTYEEDNYNLVFDSLDTYVVNNLKVTPDHRIIMMSSLYLSKIGGGEVDHFDEVRKSFPNFIDLIN